MLHLQIHQLGWKHHIVVQICHDQKRSDDDKSNQISGLNTQSRLACVASTLKSLVTVMSLGLSEWSPTDRLSGHSGNPALRRLSM